jgi:hypothetical protein
MAAARTACTLLVPLLVTLGCDGSDPNAQVYELGGEVLDRTSGQGIGGAEVTFVSDTLQESFATSGSDGAYRMVVRTDSPFGQVRAEREGYLPDERTVFFDTSPRRMDLRLRQAPPEE